MSCSFTLRGPFDGTLAGQLVVDTISCHLDCSGSGQSTFEPLERNTTAHAGLWTGERTALPAGS